MGHAVTFHADRMLMFGGVSETHEILNDLWQYNVTSCCWTPLGGIGPSGLLAAFAGSFVLESRLLVMLGVLIL